MRNKRIAATLGALSRNELFILKPFADDQRKLKARDMETNNRYIRFRWRRDAAFRALSLLRSRLGGAVRRQATSKALKTAQLLGCTVPEFLAHIAAQFRDGMSWENHGKWEIDHIKPCRAFDLTDPEQQKACFHYSNMQPLWMGENRSKSDSWNGQQARRAA